MLYLLTKKPKHILSIMKDYAICDKEEYVMNTLGLYKHLCKTPNNIHNIIDII